MKNIYIALTALVIALIGIFVYFNLTDSPDTTYERPTIENTPQTSTSTDPQTESSTEPPLVSEERGTESVLGTSVAGADIMAYHFGTGDTEVTLIGGVHGGYSWNTALLGYQIVDWLKANPNLIPEELTVTVIPVLNPDGLKSLTKKDGRFTANDVAGAAQTAKVAARFNANTVDINRNFGCDWAATGTWINTKVSGGTSAFSEPEAQAIRTYVETYQPKTIVTWYSSAGGVYASKCGTETMTETTELTNLYATASGYKAFAEYDYYDLTGDMVNWFASENIPAISVLLTDHTGTELSKNQAGILAVFKYAAE